MYWIYTVIALIFCLGGDILLMWEELFVFGLISFLVGHLFFILSFMVIDGIKINKWPLIILSLYGLIFYLFIFKNLGSLAIPVLVYILVIVYMGWQGISLYLWRKDAPYRMIATGVILFLLSDSLLALNKFKAPFELSGVVVLSADWLAMGFLANASTRMGDPQTNS
jgi:uncharacterized membrane protein YhhN